MEEALREVGCSEESITAISELNQFQEIESDMLTDHSIGRGHKVRAVFLTVVGRGKSKVKRLDLGWLWLSWDEVAALIVNLSSNENIETLNLSGTGVLSSIKGCTVLSQALRTNASLQDLRLGSIGLASRHVTCLMDGLQGNETLVSLDLSGNQNIGARGIKSVAQYLANNNTLKVLGMRGIDCGLEDINHLSSELQRNTKLEELMLGGSSRFKVLRKDFVKKLLNVLSTVRPQDSPRDIISTSTLRRLRFKYTEFYAEDLACMISTNERLSTLGLEAVIFSESDWKDKIFRALKENDTLEDLDLHFCKGLTGTEDALMDVLQSGNTRLENINLTATEIASWQGRVNEELRINKEFRRRMKGQATVQTTSGRLVLCGYGFAGKTAISKTMQLIELGAPRRHSFAMAFKKIVQMFPRFRQCLFGKIAYRELATGTRGFDVVSLKKQPYLKSIWDFAGQREYYALHDYLFPDVQNSSFLYVCSCRLPPDAQNLTGVIKSQEIMRAESEFWMKFIASNSKPLQGGDTSEKQRPHVRFVLTNKDTLNPSDLNISRQRANQVVRELKGVFKDVVELCETVEVVNAHSLEDVERILTLENETLRKVMAQKTEYVICEEVRKVLDNWSADNQFQPVVSVETFHLMREGKFRIAGTSEAVREALLPYLNDLGEVIYFRGVDLIVLSPRWFGVRVLGCLIDAFKGEKVVGQACEPASENSGQRTPLLTLVHDKGYVHRKDLNDLLECSLETTLLQQTISSEKLIDLMIHLELCFEKQPGNVHSSLFLPALFDDETEAAAKGKRKLEWKLVQTGLLHYLGRRLECDNKAITFLTPGFFPRLQVHLRNCFYEKGWTDNLGFGVDRNLLCFTQNGVEVIIEYSGDIDYFVDVLVRSSKPYADALELIDKHVVAKIQQFCASPQGCQGVLLVEAVIRPVCVKELFLCIDRKFHSVLVSTLKVQIEEDILYKHTWSHRIEDVSDTDFALDLLGGERQEVTPKFPKELTDSFPKLFYPSIEDVGMLRMFDVRLNLARKMPIKLHLLCDHKDGSHKVEDQPGRTIQLNWKAGGYDMNITKLALTLLWAGVSVGVGVASHGAAAVNLPMVDSWIQSLFNVREIPDVDAETLQQMMNPDKTGTPSEREILKALERYWKIDPYTLGLKEILNLQDGTQFWKDFQLRRVVYTETDDESRIGWVCDRHYRRGLKEKILHSMPL